MGQHTLIQATFGCPGMWKMPVLSEDPSLMSVFRGGEGGVLHLAGGHEIQTKEGKYHSTVVCPLAFKLSTSNSTC